MALQPSPKLNGSSNRKPPEASTLKAKAEQGKAHDGLKYTQQNPGKK